jgi:uncharacterized protein (TIGR02453 family)
MNSDYNLSTTLAFLKKIQRNNNREWFIKNKEQYQQAHDQLICFADAVLTEMNKQDVIETPSGKKSVFRIYNDVRFSKDKSPYKNYLGGAFRRATKLLRGGYYYHIEPGNTYVAGGFFNPNAEDLLHIRQQISADPSPIIDIVKHREFKKTFGTLSGEQVKTVPRGFSLDDPGIEFIRYKQFILKHIFSPEEVLQPDFHFQVAKTFHKMRPFLNYMSEILTTDPNGISIV